MGNEFNLVEKYLEDKNSQLVSLNILKKNEEVLAEELKKADQKRKEIR